MTSHIVPCASKCVIPVVWSIIVLSFITVCDAQMSQDEMRNMEGVKFKTREDVLKLRAARLQANGSTHDNYVHPYNKPGEVKTVLNYYRRYREMILVKRGTFWMGANDPSSKTGEYPMKQVFLNSFYLDANPVINADFWAFRRVKRFMRTGAETKGWSWVVDMFLSDETRQYYSIPGARGWAAVKKAIWNAPEGPDSNLDDRWNHPVVHVSWYDAKDFCEYHGKRLPSEAEWEFAARANVTANEDYPWGESWQKKRANVWQGKWPTENKKGDGYSITSPVDAFVPQNFAGFYDMIGNVWEWTESRYIDHQVAPHLRSKMVVLKGGSYVDSVSGEINSLVRNGQRLGLKQEYTAANVGFRCAKSAPEVDEEIRRPSTTTSRPMQDRKKRMKIHRRRRDEL